MSDQKVSIIIPHRNQPIRLQECLGRLIELGYEKHEILVVDNGSDVILDFLKDYPVKLLHSIGFPSPYIARNLGIEKSNGTIIVLLDVNAIVEPGWLEAALELLQPNCILAGIPKRPDPRDLDVYQRFDYLYAVIDPVDDQPIMALPAANLFFHRSLWEPVGPFREVRSLGDIEWTSRARDMGYSLIVNSEVRYDYPYKSDKIFKKKFQRLGSGKAENKSVSNPLWYVIKNFLPPSPRFVQRMCHKNRREKMGLSVFQVFILCYFVKINYGIGAARYWFLGGFAVRD